MNSVEEAQPTSSSCPTWLTASQRKSNGAYYTPAWIARLLLAALNLRPERILDPAMGAGVFLLEASTRWPTAHLSGIDIDERACQIVKDNLLQAETRASDFLRLEGSSLGVKHDLIIGNPPYVAHQAVEDDYPRYLRERWAREGIHLSGMASLWAYFVIHALTFLRLSGSLCFIVPRAILDTNYGRDTLSVLQRRFERVQLVVISERMFESTDQDTVILLATNFGRPGTISVQHARGVCDITECIRNTKPAELFQVPDCWKFQTLPSEVQQILGHLLGDGVLATLGALADVRIGVVTGANDYFIRDVQAANNILGSNSTQFIVRRRAWLRGTFFCTPDADALRNEANATELIQASSPYVGSVANWINEGEMAGFNKRTKCRQRQVWHQISDTRAPDAFLHYMSGRTPPRIVANRTAATCTNAIHRLFWHRRPDEEELHRLVLASCTTIFALSAEIFGRSYGGGVLKVEPSEASRLWLPQIDEDATTIANTVDSKLRSADYSGATELADRYVLRELHGLDVADTNALRHSLEQLRQSREGERR